MELWHVLNRGVEGRELFLDDSDFLRFVHNLYAFNDTVLADQNVGYRFKSRGVGNPYIEKEREKLVEIHGWCLMKNHYHLLLSELVEGGLSLFLRKINTGYANYFNLRYNRFGTLFAGKTRRIAIEHEAHYLYILHYIHLNPLDYLEGCEDWRVRSGRSVRTAQEALAYLEEYRWSSYRDYAGIRNFPSLLTKSMFEERSGEYIAELQVYLADAEACTSALGRMALEN